jgi:2-isopropylmalate synthase
VAKLGRQLEPELLTRAFVRFKDLADRKVSVTDADLEAIVAEELGVSEDAAFAMESLAMAGGTHLSPTATVRLRRNGDIVEDSAMGDGMIDAAYGAIGRATGVDAKLVAFNVSAVTGGSDALGDVVVQLDVDGRLVTGRGVAADVVEASARAYLAAINRAAALAEGAAG